ncbi:MAG: Asp-tRNA(Asn)/Glu-tRNA(Gln) amidotransferase subunit GatC [Patescibacteria group bacterium]
MISREEVVNLAALARLALPEGEVEKLRQDLGSILDYFTRLKVDSETNEVTPTRTSADNTLRTDGAPHEAGIHTERLLAMSPVRQGGYFVVKPIFPNDVI